MLKNVLIPIFGLAAADSNGETNFAIVSCNEEKECLKNIIDILHHLQADLNDSIIIQNVPFSLEGRNDGSIHAPRK